ncbi:hypothetical protein BRC79_07525 [Halobacteriales archaeon QH_8_67_27]|nr:MAG: hypothetical protein BRC79_07525 [Halobacteriales archaeon QH_8_67_27]
MNTFEVVIRLVAGAALILTNGFFVAIEFGLIRARQSTESEFVGDGSSAASKTRSTPVQRSSSRTDGGPSSPR